MPSGWSPADAPGCADGTAGEAGGGELNGPALSSCEACDSAPGRPPPFSPSPGEWAGVGAGGSGRALYAEDSSSISIVGPSSESASESASPGAESRYGFESSVEAVRGSADGGLNGRGPRPRRGGRRRSFIWKVCYVVVRGRRYSCNSCSGIPGARIRHARAAAGKQLVSLRQSPNAQKIAPDRRLRKVDAGWRDS